MKALPVIIALFVLTALLLWFLLTKDEMVKSSPTLDESTLPTPVKHPPRDFVANWEKLNAYHNTISSNELRTLIEEVYTVDDVWKEVITIDDKNATIQTSEKPFVLQLRSATDPPPEKLKRYWNDGPLDSLHIAIDPGHIGGKYADIEKRQFGHPGDKPVREGELTLLTAKRLKPLLEAMGAKVTLVRKSNAPVTRRRAKDYLKLYKKYNPGIPNGFLMPYSEKRFYRRAEIVARAKLVNEKLKPDLVLCLHYNASSDSASWVSTSQPILVEENHFHLLLNGAYTRGEVLNEEDRFQMLERIVQRIHRREAELGKVVADVFAEQTGLPPYSYDPNSSRAKNVDGHPYLWARNLLANRSYTCPVLFFEPWVMNNKEVYARIQEGDYDGLRTVEGKSLPSIMSEYAEAVASGIAKFYSEQ